MVVIDNAKNLSSSDYNGKSDPYVIIYVNNKEEGKTKVISNNLNPIWRETFELVLNLNDNIEFKIYDHDNLNKDDYLGSVFIQMN